MFITQQNATENKKQLLNALSINKKGVVLLNKQNPTAFDFRKAKEYSSKVDFKTKEKEIVIMMFDICVALSKTYCNDDVSTKSTALTSQYNGNWTIGSFGSIFVDLIVNDKELRVSFFTKDMAKEYGYEKPFFWVESLELNMNDRMIFNID